MTIRYMQLVFLMALAATTSGCAKNDDTAVSSESSLYFATGQCNSGSGITTLSSTLSSRMVAKIGLTSKEQKVVFDLAAEYQGGFFAPETGAQSIVNNGSSILMLTENATNMGDRKIFSIPKSTPYNTVIFASDVLALTQTASNITRSMVTNPDGTLLFSKSIAIEKIGTNTLRIPSGANPYVSAPAGTCATSTTMMSAMVVLPNFTGTSTGKIIYAHQGTTTAINRLGIINRDGYSVAADCYNGYQVSNLNNNTTFNYGIVMYDVTETSATAATISSTGTILYRDFSTAFGISAMAYDSTNKHLYVATASQPGVANQTTAAYGYKVEKFALDLTATTVPKLTLVRVNNKPFMDRSSFTKCITSMFVGE